MILWRLAASCPARAAPRQRPMAVSSSTRVLLVGAGAQLAGALIERLTPACTLIPRTRPQLDVTSARAVDEAVAEVAPDVVVNCASFNDVDGAERDPVTALRVNGLAVGHLADACRRSGAVLVHYSTDFVFDPVVDPGMLREDDPLSPGSIYAQSKLLGEVLARRAPRHYVLRVASLFGGRRGHSSLDRIASALDGGAPVKAFANRTVTPSYVVDLAEALVATLDRAVPYGLYHCVNTGRTTWVDVATALARALGRNPAELVVPTPFDPAMFPARRPTYAALSNAAIAAHGVVLPGWEDAIMRFARARARADDA